MKRISVVTLFTLSLFHSFTSVAQQLNMPIIQTKYTADPAPYVHGDTVYLYTSMTMILRWMLLVVMLALI